MRAVHLALRAQAGVAFDAVEVDHHRDAEHGEVVVAFGFRRAVLSHSVSGT